jgi:hypothetical protein
VEAGAGTARAGESTSYVYKKFREKYGVKDVKRYYSKFEVAVVVQLT